MPLDENNKELLNSVYKEINEEFGIDVAMRMYQLYKGTQVNFPMRFLNPDIAEKFCITNPENGSIYWSMCIGYN